MPIVFENIPNSLLIPGNYSALNISLAKKSLPMNRPKMVLLGQKTSAGTATTEKPVEIASGQDADTYAGVGSFGALALKAALDANENVDLSFVPMIDIVGGTAAVGTITVSGIASSTGFYEIWIGKVKFEVVVENLDAENDIATAINTALVAKQHLTPFTFTVATNVITATCRHKGTLGNNIAISYKNNKIGTTTLAVVQPTGGLLDPSLANSLTAIFPADYDIVVSTLNDATNLGLLKTHLDDISAPQEDRPCVGCFARTSDLSTMKTLCGTTLNSYRMLGGYYEYVKTTERGHSTDFELAGGIGSIIAKHEHTATPYDYEEIPGIVPCSLENKLSTSEQQSALENGVTPLIEISGNKVAFVRAVSTYITDDSGFETDTMLDITTIRTLDYVQATLEFKQNQVFTRELITANTPADMKSLNIATCQDLEELNFVKNVDQHIDKFISEFGVPGRINNSVPASIVQGLHIIANEIVLISE